MKILFLTSHFPYPMHSGGALRAAGLIQGAAEAGHEIHLLSFTEQLPETSPLHEICAQIITVAPPPRTLTDRLRDLLLTQRADMGRRFWSEEALARMAQTIRQYGYDLVHAESIEMAVYLLPLREIFPDLPLVYGSLNAEARLQRSAFLAELGQPKRFPVAGYSLIQWRRLYRLERQICRVADCVLAVSEPDREILAQQSATPVHLVKNGIHVAPYLGFERSEALGEGAIVFTGSMDYRPNIDAALWFVHQILPLLVYPKPHVYIVGKKPSPRILALQGDPALPVTVTGAVEDMSPYWTGSQVYIAPLRMGSGTRFKLLEAMATQCAIVSTSIGAMGLDVTSGRELILADTAGAFAAAVDKLLGDAGLRAEIGKAGQDFVQKHFDWSAITPHLLNAYNKIKR